MNHLQSPSSQIQSPLPSYSLENIFIIPPITNLAALQLSSRPSFGF
jgi:hypothetical protein